MKGDWRWRNITLAVLVTTIGSSNVARTAPAEQASKFADVAFQSTWERTDLLVAQSKAKRSWYWGPQPNTSPLQEDYAEGPGGKRLVQYFDKSRMEINDPKADKSNPFFVTNGLLTQELISGNMQVGNNKFVERWPAEILIVGDDPLGPTYAAFRNALEGPATDQVGKLVTTTISKKGKLDFVQGGPGYKNYDKYGVKYVYFERITGRSIPNVFSDFLNAKGLVVVSGKQIEARLSDPYFYATGYPISQAYWTDAAIQVSNQRTPVLVQAYQRRMLTYVPTNPEGFKVEMGNIGQHYYDWRYKDAGRPPSVAGICDIKPTLGFGKVYNENRAVQLGLGCALGPERRATTTWQEFQLGGKVIGVVNTDPTTGKEYEDVFILHANAKLEVFPDNPVMSGPEPTPSATPPAGFYTPTGNLGKVWRDNPMVREALGWATEPAIVEALDKNKSGTGGVVQEFEGGWIVYPVLEAKEIYVLFLGVNSYSWIFYWDTFQP